MVSVLRKIAFILYSNLTDYMNAYAREILGIKTQENDKYSQ